jgi:hypothetical protein
MGSTSQFTDDNEVAAFLGDMRAAYVSDPEEATASRHIAAIAHEAELVLGRRTPKPSWRRTMIRNRFTRPIAALSAAMLATVLATAGLAAAGVDLPDPAKDAFNKVGISLPNQAGGGQSGEHSRSDAVHSVLEATPPSERGCAFGHSVAEAAKGSPLPEQAQAACDRNDENGDAAAHKNSSSSHSEFGRDTAERARGLKDATPEERRSFGEDPSDRARELGGAPDGSPGAQERSETPAGGTTGAPEGTPGPPEGTPQGRPDTAPVPDGTPTGAPDGTPGGHP